VKAAGDGLYHEVRGEIPQLEPDALEWRGTAP
jgi:hypothetical protein